MNKICNVERENMNLENARQGRKYNNNNNNNKNDGTMEIKIWNISALNRIFIKMLKIRDKHIFLWKA